MASTSNASLESRNCSVQNGGPYFHELSGLQRNISTETEKLFQPATLKCDECKGRDHLAVWEKWLVYLIRAGKVFQTFPITYNSCDGVLHLTQLKIIIIMWYLRLIALSADSMYLIGISKKVDIQIVGEKEFVDFWAHCVSRVMACIIMWAISIKWQGTVQIFNTLTENRRNWSARYGSWGSDFSGPLEKHFRRSLQCGVVVTLLQPIIPLALHLGNRNSARYWGGQFLPAKLYNSVPGIVLFAFYDYSMSTLAIQNCGYVILLMVAYFALMQFWTLSIMEKMESVKKLTSNTPLYQYRCLLALGRVGNCCMGTSLFPTLLFLGCFLLCVLLSGLVKGGSELPPLLLVNLIGPSLLVLKGVHFVLEGGSLMLRRSRDLKRLFKLEQDLYRRKYVRSLRDMRIYIGEFFFVAEKTFITSMRFVLDQTITLIFAF